jgi:electron transport complex protein RnfA
MALLAQIQPTFTNLLLLVLVTVLINNFVLHYFVGICSFIGLSRRLDTSFGMGMAVTFVITFSGILTKAITYFVTGNLNVAGGQVGVLTTLIRPGGVDLSFLNYVIYILVIAGAVQFVEMYVRKFFPGLYQAFGVYLALISTNCCILFACLLVMTQNSGFLEATLFSFSGGVGYTIGICLMAGIRGELEYADVPAPLQGPGLTLIAAGILALAFMGFNGIGR